MNVTLGDDATTARWVSERLPDHPEYELCTTATMGVMEGDQLIAGVVFLKYVGHDIHIDFAADSPKWMSPEVMYSVFAYPFLQLGCVRVSAVAPANNVLWNKLLMGMGFRLEGQRRLGQSFAEDQFIYGMLKSECRWINYDKLNAESTESAGPESSYPAPNAVKH